MEFLAKPVTITKLKAECVVVSIIAENQQSQWVDELNQLSEGRIHQLIKSGDISSEIGAATFFYSSNAFLKQKILFVGCGKTKEFSLAKSKKVVQAVVKGLIEKKVNSAEWDILSVNPAICNQLSHIIPQMVGELTYQFNEFKSNKAPQPKLNKITFSYNDKKTLKQIEDNLVKGNIIANAVHATKRLADMPSNICNPQYLAEQGKKLEQHYASLNVSCFGEKDLEALNMNAYLAVGRGSHNESIMTVIEYRGAQNSDAKPYILVGKGLTFDSGGISIKPAASMDEMKYDMCGAATVYGVMQAVAELALPINVIGIMAGSENMSGSDAYRPGDILTTMSGKTVEIINTDAEGRLVLCDVLTYVERYNPEIVIDIATLTGACIVALGHHYTGVLGNNDNLVKKLVTASNLADDKAWSLPIDDDFQHQIKSTCADMVNAAGRDGGTITAACFLSRFTEKYKWAHLDIAGTAWRSGANKGATGRPVAMLIHYLLSQTD